MAEPTITDTGDIADGTAYLATDPADLAGNKADELSARVRTQRRVTQAQSAVSDAVIRARRSAKLPHRRKAETTHDAPRSALSAIVDGLQAYGTYVLGAAAALITLIAVARKRSSAPQVDDSVDLGDWHLRADPPGEGV